MAAPPTDLTTPTAAPPASAVETGREPWIAPDFAEFETAAEVTAYAVPPA